jgi:hypothetical protein
MMDAMLTHTFRWVRSHPIPGVPVALLVALALCVIFPFTRH